MPCSPVLSLAAGRRAAVFAGVLGLGLIGACSRSGFPDLADLVEQNSPSVVNISAVQSTGADATRPARDDRPGWLERFEDAHPDQPLPSESREEPLGSGFVLWEDGYILTNFHVIQGADQVIVRMLDRRQLPARIVGIDPPTDLALLQVDAEQLQAVRIGDAARLRPGQWVFAIGSPFSFDFSVTAGVISAKGRNLRSEQYVPFLQTDVAINPGNSGSPLFNLAGEVIGINSQIYSQSGSFQGVSFAIPIDVAAKVARQLRDTGAVARGWLGVVVEDVDHSMAQSYGMDKPEGARVVEVVPGSPADEAGIRAGDVILTFDGQPLATSTGLPPLVGGVDPGQLAGLQLIRDGKRLDFRVEIDNLDQAPRPGEGRSPRPSPPPSRPEPMGALGLGVSPLSDKQRRDMRILSGGVLVQTVHSGPAAVAGIHPGDVILSVAGQEIDSPRRLAEVASRLTPDSSVPVLVSRDGAPSFVTLKVPPATDRASP